MADPALTRWSVVIPAARVEEAYAHLLDVFPEGIAEMVVGDGVELSSYLPAGEPTGPVPDWLALTAAPVPAGWRDAWRAFHRPVEIAGTWIRPPWLDEPADALLLEPGYAFGTGSHPTTRGAGALLRDEPPGALLDLGCGSGLLSILAATWGHGPIAAWDRDPHAVEATRANLERNGLGDRVDVRLADVLVEPLPPADLALANIERRVNEALLRRDGLPARVVVSGVRADDAFDLAGWRVERELVDDGWRTLLLVR